MDNHSEGSSMAKNQNRRSLRIQEKRAKQNLRHVKRNVVLPDDVLLEIFDFYVNMGLSYVKGTIEAWQALAHVCRQWRSLVFQSPRRLNLRLFCTPKTPAENKLDIWPSLPLLVTGSMTLSSGTQNVIAALRESHRICEVNLDLAGWQLEKVMAPMQVPFPELTVMELMSHGETLSAIPDSFLGGSAPSLRSFSLTGIPFPGLPKLVLSANHLVTLWLSNIPHSGYISPEAMVTPFSVLSSLETLSLQFHSPQSRPLWESQSLPPPKRSVLPALNKFHFKGVTEYLEQVVTRIDTPHLNEMHITFFNQIDFDCPQLAQFFNCAPVLRDLNEAHVLFASGTASVKLRFRNSQAIFDNLEIAISCREQDWQISSLEQVSSSFLHLLSTVEDLYIECRSSDLFWRDDAIENTQWLQLLLPFTAVKNLYISKEIARGIAPALEELVGDRTTEALPSLRIIFVLGRVVMSLFDLEAPAREFEECIQRFVFARRLSGYSIAISYGHKEYQ